MKRLLLLLCILFGLQNVYAQCIKHELTAFPDFKVCNNDAPVTSDFLYPTTGIVRSTFIGPNDDKYVTGDFKFLQKYDGTNTGITQTLLGLNGFAHQDHTTGTWYADSPPPGGIAKAWYFNNTIYASYPSGFCKRNPDNTWTNILPGAPINIIPSNTPNEYYMCYSANAADPIGMYLWNSTTNVLTPIANATRPTSTTWYRFEESQTSDTIFVTLHHVVDYNAFLVKGETNLRYFGVDIPAYDPSLTWMCGGFFLNGKIYVLTRDVQGIVYLQYTAGNSWYTMAQTAPGFVIGYGINLWYDNVTHRLSCPYVKGFVDINTNTFTADTYGVEPNFRHGDKLLWTADNSCGGLFFADTTRPATTNLSYLGFTTLYAPQDVTLTGSNEFIGDNVKIMTLDSVILDQVTIDNTNCSSYSLTISAKNLNYGNNDFIITSTDPSGNVSDPQTITFSVVAPNGTHDVSNNESTQVTCFNNMLRLIDIKDVEIYDITGKVIFSSRNSINELQLNYPTGMYIVRATTTDGKVFSKKITLN